MRKGEFGLKVITGQELDNGLVVIKHGQQYKLRLSNYNPHLRCDATVEIDGKVVGYFRIGAYSSITIERPTNDYGIFTFYRHGSSEAEHAGLTGTNNEGLITVTFVHEQIDNFVNKSFRRDASFCRTTGGTGLSGHSDDKYVDAGNMSLDQQTRTLIQTRLVCHEGPRPLI